MYRVDAIRKITALAQSIGVARFKAGMVRRQGGRAALAKPCVQVQLSNEAVGEKAEYRVEGACHILPSEEALEA